MQCLYFFYLDSQVPCKLTFILFLPDAQTLCIVCHKVFIMAHAVPGMCEVAEGISDEFITCPVCTNAYSSPKILPCMHSFCEKCLADSLNDSEIKNGQAFLCPICQYQCFVPNRGVASFPTNVFIETLFEFAQRKASPAKVKEPPKPTCEGCEDDRIYATMKCMECDDWLCGECVRMHRKVKLTRGHHLADVEEVQAGAYDEMLKDNFEPLQCIKHEEPLKLYCTESSCQKPICTVCKSTSHDGHRAIEITEQGAIDVDRIHLMTDVIRKNIEAVMDKIRRVKLEDEHASRSRKEIHADINARMEAVVEMVVKQITKHADSLHEEVEVLSKAHKKELGQQMEDAKFKIEGMNSVMTFSANIVNFGRSEEIVTMAKQLIKRLDDFQMTPSLSVPKWREPKLHPLSGLPDSTIKQMYGTLTFEGELIKCGLVNSFSTALAIDKKICSLSDISITPEGDILIVDKDNKMIKVFDASGGALFNTEISSFNAPKSISLFQVSGNALIKDDKQLKILEIEGGIIPGFAPYLKQPVGLCSLGGVRFLITDWVSGNIHCINEDGQEEFKFPSQTEAPSYICSDRETGRIAISDWKHNVVKVFAMDGKILFQYGLDGDLNHPFGLSFDRHGHLLIADNWNHRVHLVDEHGKLIQYLLTADDGLQRPVCLAINPLGNLIVAEAQGAVKTYKYLA